MSILCTEKSEGPTSDSTMLTSYSTMPTSYSTMPTSYSIPRSNSVLPSSSPSSHSMPREIINDYGCGEYWYILWCYMMFINLDQWNYYSGIVGGEYPEYTSDDDEKPGDCGYCLCVMCVEIN